MTSAGPSFVLQGDGLFYLPWRAEIRSQLDAGFLVEKVRLNDDERDDAIVVAETSVYVMVQGQSAFDLARFSAITDEPFAFGYTADVDGDGDPDIILEAADGLYWLQNMCDEVLSGATQGTGSSSSGTTGASTTRPPITLPSATRVTLTGEQMDLSQSETMGETTLIAIGVGSACCLILLLLAALRFRRARRHARQSASPAAARTSSVTTSRPVSRRATRGTSAKKVHHTPTTPSSASSSSQTLPPPSSSSARSSANTMSSTHVNTYSTSSSPKPINSYSTASGAKSVNAYSPSQPVPLKAYHQTSLYPAPASATYPSPG